MPGKSKSARKTRSQKRGGAYSSRSPTVLQGSPVQNGGKNKSRKNSRQTLKRKQKGSRKLQRKSFLSTLNQMGGYIRDGSTQFFKILKGDEAN